MLYAIGVGAGTIDHTGFELEYTTENSLGFNLSVLPTFAAIIGQTAIKLSVLGEIDSSKLVHGEQTITVNGAIPVRGSLDVSTTVAGVYDKGSGALIVLESRGIDVESGSNLLTTRMGLFLRGAGGFGGPRGPDQNGREGLAFLEREPDHLVRYSTRADQALLYRLSGDRNPLHSDPAFAKMAGFDRPILHGLCTYGFAGRALLHTVCNSDASMFGSMTARFSRPTYPGDELTTQIWEMTDRPVGSYHFRVVTQRDEVVIDGGLFQTSAALAASQIE